jgi:hypothetical protein
MTLEQALAVTCRKVQISPPGPKDGARELRVYRLDDHGATLLAQTWLPEPEHDAMVAALRSRGLPVAETDLESEMVWHRTTDGIEVYDRQRKLFDAAGDRATTLAGTVVARNDLVRVLTYADGYAERGIKGVLRSGAEVKLVIEFSLSAEEDHTYSRNQLLFETAWCGTVGIAIAKWAGAAYENHI